MSRAIAAEGQIAAEHLASYILRAKVDSRWPVLSGWVGYQVGRAPEPEVEESGLCFHPSVDQTLGRELHRPFGMLDEGAIVRDASGRSSTFAAPFFVGDDGAHGEPEWPVEVAGDPRASADLRVPSRHQKVSAWAARRVEPAAFDQAR